MRAEPSTRRVAPRRCGRGRGSDAGPDRHLRGEPRVAPLLERQERPDPNEREDVEEVALLDPLRRHVDEIAFLRSVYGRSNDHVQGTYEMQTGQINLGFPSVGSWLTYGLGSTASSLPAYVVMTDARGGPLGGVNDWSSGFIPAAYQGTLFRSTGDPIIDLKPPSSVSSEQQRARRLGGDAVHHLAPELVRHELVERRFALCEGAARRDPAGVSRLRPPQALDMALGEDHRRVETDHRKAPAGSSRVNAVAWPIAETNHALGNTGRSSRRTSSDAPRQ